ncbi:MAG: ketoacyl-ACP synthase III [Oscillospiraceae bacterium]|nr:ketoacyl-ACP synthase III [Oscillospiraceae bacterium]
MAIRPGGRLKWGVFELCGINILGTGAYLPEIRVDNNMLADLVDTSDEWITTRTGMKQRHMVNGETTWYMGAMASKRAIEDAGIDASEIGLIVDATITSDFYTPSAACVIQREIGAFNAAAFDLNAACTGFVYSLDTAKRFLQTDPNLKYVLVVANEMLSGITDFTDRSSCILFGDGAGAVIIERSEKLYGSWLGANGNLAHALYAKLALNSHPFKSGEPVSIKNSETEFTESPAKLVQHGKDVYKFATNALPTASLNACKSAGIDISEIDVFIPHQANIRIIETASKNLNIPIEKFILNLQNVGNTSGASIPLAFDKFVKNGHIKRGQKCCLVGFGAGSTLGAIVLEY